MRILHLNKAYPPHVGGIEYHLRTLAEAQAAAGHHVTVLCCNRQRHTLAEEIAGVRVVRAGRWGRVSSLPIAPGTARWLARIPADIVHVHVPYPLGEIVATRLPPQRPVVATWHSDIVRQRLLGALYRPWQRRFAARCQAILVPTPHHIDSSALLPAVRERCHVVPFGIPLPGDAPPHGKGLSLGVPYVLCVGRLVRYKGIHVLLDAWRYVEDLLLYDTRESTPRDVRLVVIGDGPWARRLRRQARDLDIDKRVLWIRSASDATVRAAMRDALFLVLPSVSNNEAFGLVQLEAMALGKPVVATRLPTGVSYVNRHKETGLLADVGDAQSLAAQMATLLADAQRRETYGRAAADHVREDYTVEKMLAGTLAVYEQALTDA